ncbi:Hypothetical predicted protein [Octopus vulgaris]|uniref:Uncharacterized protein n=1 Tax=Octopus vulgaris TaxID=6645 RepID=A0AA36AP34_OCTVU|nr:Hypothetical predicted protein [Octopus vulgaris]
MCISEAGGESAIQKTRGVNLRKEHYSLGGKFNNNSHKAKIILTKRGDIKVYPYNLMNNPENPNSKDFKENVTSYNL